MKKKITILITALLLFGSVIALSSCAGSIFDEKGEEGYTVGIRFDAGDGSLKDRENASIVELYNPDKAVNGEIKIPDPEDESLRGKDGAFKAKKLEHHFIGWYREKHEVVGEDGKVSYTYSGKWDFSKDTVKIDPDKKYDPNQPVMTLYAAYVPYFTCEFYAENESGEMELLTTVEDALNLEMPDWNTDTGTMSYNDLNNYYSKLDDAHPLKSKTFDAAYLDAEMTQRINGVLDAEALYIDYEKGIATTDTIKIYTTWLDGKWFKIYTAKQFVANSSLDGNYIICADLDFSKQIWKTELSTGTFNGTIRTENDQQFKFSGITAKQSGTKPAQGLFGALGYDAVIENISFENLTYELNVAYPIKLPTYFGLLAGQRNTSEDGKIAVLSNITVSGTVEIKGTYNPQNEESNYVINKLIALGSLDGIVASEVLVKVTGKDVTATEDSTDSNVIILQKQ